MALTRRGRRMAVLLAAALVVVLVAGYFLLGGNKTVSSLASKLTGGKSPTPAPPPTCPLTGKAPSSGSVPNRPALAIKVENLPQARPQTGLQSADIVYEEPVEAYITRFIVVFQCHEASRVEPVRSARMEDPDILLQFGKPLFGYAGGVPSVMAAVKRAGIHDVNFNIDPSAYPRDPNRYAPHNLYTSTEALWKYAPAGEGAPKPVFTYSRTLPSGATPATSVHLDFSLWSNVTWKWSAKGRTWVRYYNGTTPANLSDGQIISARNIVVQVVKVTNTGIVDPNGVHSPFAHVIGSGKAYIFRGGHVIVGRWIRSSVGQITKFVDSSGKVIPLTPGNTWVELYPQNVPKVTWVK